MLNYYQKHEQFSVTANEYWRTHLSQFEILYQQYNIDSTTILTIRTHSNQLTINFTSIKNIEKPTKTERHSLKNSTIGTTAK